MTHRIWFVVALLAVNLPLAQAERVYRWVDKDGNVSYRDRPPPTEEAGRVEERQFRVRENRAAPATEAPTVAVVIYTVPQCSSCDQARAHLEKRGVPFSEKNVDKDRAAQDELQKRSGALSVPTIVVGEKVMKGYIDSLLDGELDAAGFEKPTVSP